MTRKTQDRGQHKTPILLFKRHSINLAKIPLYSVKKRESYIFIRLYLSAKLCLP